MFNAVLMLARSLFGAFAGAHGAVAGFGGQDARLSAAEKRFREER